MFELGATSPGYREVPSSVRGRRKDETVLVVAASQAFYEAATQVIPVLLLVLAIGEGRVIRTDTKQPEEWLGTALVAVFAIGVLVLGELCALKALARGGDSYVLHGATVMALVYGFTFVFAQAVKLILLGRTEHFSPARVAALGRLYMLIVVAALLVSLAILLPGLGW